MKFYSHSKLSTFEQCKLKYKFRYIDKLVPDVEKSIEAHLGSSVHSALEWFYNKVMSEQTFAQEKQHPEVDDLIIEYTRIWEKEFSPEMTIVKQGMKPKDYYNKGIHFLLDYFYQNQPFRDNTIETEKKIFIELDKNTKLIGFIDRLVHDIENDSFEIHDYKTSNSQPRNDHGENDRQLALYSIAIKESFGKEKPVTLIWHFLAHNQKLISSRTNEQLEKLKDETLQLIRKIEQTTHFEPTKSKLCDWCEYKSICPAWNNSPLDAEKKGFKKRV